MLFGLFNVSESFQSYINKILAQKLNILVIVYLYNILIYIADLSQPHMKAVCLVLDQLRKHRLFTNLKKCRFHQNDVQFLGYIVSAKWIRMKSKRRKTVKSWLKPKSVRDIQMFLPFANFYRRFIKNFGRIATSLTSMLQIAGHEAPT